MTNYESLIPKKSKINTAVILAAGRGTRLKSMTDYTPKCLIEVGNQSLLERMLSQLDACDFKTVYIVVGYQFQKIIDKFGQSFGNINIKYIVNKQWETTNNVLSLYLVTEYLKSSFLLLESDLIFDSNAIEVFSTTNLIALEKYKSYMDGTVVSLNKNDYVNKMFLNSTPGRPKDLSSLYKTVNIYSFDVNDFQNEVVPILKEILDEGRLDVYYELAFERAIKRGLIKLKAIHFKKYKWAEIDNQEDWLRAQKMFLSEDDVPIELMEKFN